tara:strand:+ start:9584 stop:10357 length:774 start_codon:yes stop_codon:yes gene_type:complete
MFEQLSKLEKKKFSLLLYGVEGIGKTSAGAWTSKPCFITAKKEHGVYRLLQRKLIPSGTKTLQPVSSYDEFIEQLNWLKTAKHDRATVVIDSIGFIEELARQKVCKEKFNDDWGETGFTAFQKGPALVSDELWPQMLDVLEDLRSRMHIVILGHSVTRTHKNPNGTDFEQYTINLHKNVLDKLYAWVEAAFFYESDVETQKEGLRTKATDISRVLVTDTQPYCRAKNRFGLNKFETIPDNKEEAKKVFQNIYKKMMT